jgi:3-deoxy-D-manno-octulosonic-acid transferase/heptosyltransferase-1
MGTPVVAIYGPTDPIQNKPFGNHVQIRKEVGCNPCHYYSCKELLCIKAISSDQVFKATEEILGLSH